MEGAATRLAELQARLRAMGGGDPFAVDGLTIVALPSLEVDRHVLARHADVLSACEERSLYLALLLRRPGRRLVFVSSEPLEESTIRSYLELLPPDERASARTRLLNVSPDDASPRPLAEKLLERPAVVARLRELVGDPRRAFLAPYATTEAEQRLALELNLPVYGAPPQAAIWGTKSGARRLFAEQGIPCAAGAEGARSAADVVDALRALRRARPDARAAVIKLDQGIYGEGNRTVSLASLPAAADGERRELSARVAALGDEFLAEVAAGSAVIEERLTGRDLRSPSVQLRIRADGRSCEISTHEQILGGPTGLTFVGCRFPADAAYAPALVSAGRAVADRLAREGVMGRFGVDFVVTRDADRRWRAHAIEINLRDGGTTHSYGVLRLLTGGEYDPERTMFRTATGEPRYYRASDDLEDAGWVGVPVDDLLAEMGGRRLRFDSGAQVGAVLHMTRSLAPAGRIGVTAIADTAARADEIYDRTIGLLHELGDRDATRGTRRPSYTPPSSSAVATRAGARSP